MDTKVEQGVIGTIAFIVAVNFGVMIRLSVKKIILSCKKRKATAEHKKEMSLKLSQEEQQEDETPIVNPLDSAV